MAATHWLPLNSGVVFATRTDPSVIVTLAFAQANYFSFTQSQAQAEIQKIMATPEYGKGDRLELLKIQYLSRVAHGATPNTLTAFNKATLGQRPSTPAAQQRNASVMDELRQLIPARGEMSPEQRAKYLDTIRRIK